jgi:hypothetical protein
MAFWSCTASHGDPAMNTVQNTVVYLLLTALNQPSEAAYALPPHVMVVEEGVVLKFATVAEISSETAKKGDEVPLQLTRPLIIDGVTLLPIGTQVRGRVSELKKAGPKCRAGLIYFKVDQVRFLDGSVAPTEVYYRNPRPDAPVPEKVDSGAVRHGRLDHLDDYAEIVLVVPFLVVYLISALFSKNGTPCVGVGSDYVFPAGSTIGVMIGKKHRVRY